jgi:hypothetical protein
MQEDPRKVKWQPDLYLAVPMAALQAIGQITFFVRWHPGDPKLDLRPSSCLAYDCLEKDGGTMFAIGCGIDLGICIRNQGLP